jgi:TDG/mug DNA glycosylase family protein
MTPVPPLQALPDVIAPGLSVVFCGINPGATSAATGRHFAQGSNRFWRAIHLAGFTPRQLSPEEAPTLLEYRCGLTTAVDRPTSRADELSRHEFIAAAASLERKIEHYAPRHVAFLGKVAYTVISGRREVAWGPQLTMFGGAAVWVLPNPSGLNRSFRLDDLVDAYSQLRVAVVEGL